MGDGYPIENCVFNNDYNCNLIKKGRCYGLIKYTNRTQYNYLTIGLGYGAL